MFHAREPQVNPWQVLDPLFVVAGPTHTLLCPSAACLDLHHPQAVKEKMICALKDLKDDRLRDEHDHALIQGSQVGPSHQACVTLLRVQSDLGVCPSQESLDAKYYCWDLTCQREQLRN